MKKMVFRRRGNSLNIKKVLKKGGGFMFKKLLKKILEDKAP